MELSKLNEAIDRITATDYDPHRRGVDPKRDYEYLIRKNVPKLKPFVDAMLDDLKITALGQKEDYRDKLNEFAMRDAENGGNLVRTIIGTIVAYRTSGAFDLASGEEKKVGSLDDDGRF